jgi:hypothetical protein
MVFLIKTLLTIQEKLYNDLLVNDNVSRFALGKLKYELLTIEARYTKGLEPNSFPIVSKVGMPMATASGAVIAGFLMLMYLIWRKSNGMKKFNMVNQSTGNHEFSHQENSR